MIYNWSPPFAIVGAFFILTILVFWGAILLKRFWNSFLADVFRVRTVTYEEALALVLIIAILLF